MIVSFIAGIIVGIIGTILFIVATNDVVKHDTKRSTIPFEEDAVKAYLDKCIRYWREHPAGCASRYIDAYQSVRESLFGERLPLEK